jgi:hypothetical protein
MSVEPVIVSDPRTGVKARAHPVALDFAFLALQTGVISLKRGESIIFKKILI